MTSRAHEKVYSIRRDPKTKVVRAFVQTRGESYHLPLRLDLYNHSPTGFEYGYGGSGPAQLALAILADCVTDQIALALHQRFKAKVIATRDREKSFIIRDKEIMRFILDHMKPLDDEQTTGSQNDGKSSDGK